MLSGHADQSGSDEHNLELSKRRVEKIKNYLLSKSIPDRIMKTRYFGERYPIVKLADQNELYINRRVEIEIIPLNR